MNTMPNWLIYCRPGFERDCVEETQARPVTAIPGSGYVVLQGKPRLSYRQLVFARQLLRLLCEVRELPERDRLAPLLAALPKTPACFGALLLENPDSNEGKTMSGFTRRFNPILETALRSQSRLVDNPLLPRLHIFFPDSQRALIACSDPNNSSAALNGIQRVSMAGDAPSRSYLKLAEAFEVFLTPAQQAQYLGPGMNAVDLGAAPGGWTWQLVRRGLNVIAVDNGPLKGMAAAHPRIRHLREDGFHYRPKHAVDWLVCDMVEQPQRVAELMTAWMAQGWARRIIFNLKLPMKQRVGSLHTALNTLHNSLEKQGIGHQLQAKQLYHDREEVTVYLARTRR